jgi:hypothetical protein
MDGTNAIDARAPSRAEKFPPSFAMYTLSIIGLWPFQQFDLVR